MRVFLTGATGVVGRRAVPLLIAAGHAVTAVGRNPEKRRQLERMGAVPVALDLFSRDDVLSAVAGHDAVVNLATHIPPGMQTLVPWLWRENDRVRQAGSAILSEAARAGGVRRFIQESFAPIYPDRGDRWIDERTPLEPVRFNRSVLVAERSAEQFRAGGGVGIVLRFGAFYGPDADHVVDLIKMIRRGWAAMPGPAESLISSVSHDDAASAVVAALDTPSGTYNVVDDEPVTHRDYVDALAAALGAPAPRLPPAWAARLFGPVGGLLARSLRISNRSLKQATGWQPKYPSVREGWRAVVVELNLAKAA
ncbi:MAG TPA: NAD(P)-dependent oxidoreductase [Stellaceae bacterium]|nr:NAD(P)-dependent oxidoreductase [Stellaceae bacterium]